MKGCCVVVGLGDGCTEVAGDDAGEAKACAEFENGFSCDERGFFIEVLGEGNGGFPEHEAEWEKAAVFGGVEEGVFVVDGFDGPRAVADDDLAAHEGEVIRHFILLSSGLMGLWYRWAAWIGTFAMTAQRKLPPVMTVADFIDWPGDGLGTQV